MLLHVSNAENLAGVSACLDRYPNTHVDIAARINELGRQPRTARRFFERYQDRIFFGTDAIPHRPDDETRSRFSATRSTKSTTASSRPRTNTSTTRPPPRRRRGAGRIYGLGLTETILEKVYSGNAARLLGLAA